MVTVHQITPYFPLLRIVFTVRDHIERLTLVRKGGRGKIFNYAKYKAWNEGIVTSRINPRNTSRECARCGALIARYNAGQEAVGYTPGASLTFCSNCQMRGNASIVVGKRLLARYQKSQEKPQAPLLADRSARSPLP